jgi:hypothetical protein
MAKVPDDLTKLSDEKLEELWGETSQAALDATAQNKAVAAEVNRRATLANARSLAERLTDSERDALAQVMAPVGIESEEQVN